jgi:hypothetical protein
MMAMINFDIMFSNHRYLLMMTAWVWACVGYAQQPGNIRISEFTYVYTGSAVDDDKPSQGMMPVFVQPRIVYALNENLAATMKASVIEAINAYWDAGLDAGSITMVTDRYNNPLRELPKFKPKVQKNNPGGYELFLRIADRNSEMMGLLTGQPIPQDTRLLFECKVLNGADGKEIFSRKMEAFLSRAEVPAGAYPLEKVPGMPASFLAAFDSAARVFFSSTSREMLTVPVEPACLFIPAEVGSTIRHTVKFEYEGREIRLVNGPEIAWAPAPLERVQTGKTKREGAGVGSGIFTAITGMSNEKEKKVIKPYMTRLVMDDRGTGVPYGFHIPVVEEESTIVNTYREKDGSGSSSVKTEKSDAGMQRRVNGPSFITRGNDTIGTFTFRDLPAAAATNGDVLLYCWNGKDSSTMMPIPDSWTNEAYNPLTVSGDLYGKPFSFTNAKAGNQLDVWYADEHVATFKVKSGLPVDGIVYESTTPDEVLKVLAMFTSLPYGYYGK